MRSRRSGLGVMVTVLLVGTLTPTGTMAKEEATSGLEPEEVCVPAAIPFDAQAIHLTGRWSDGNGAILYVRQVGDKVWFSAMSDYAQVRDEIGRDVSSVGYGTLSGTDLSVEFAEVPRGNVYNAGTVNVTLGADADGNLQGRGQTPDGDPVVYTPCQPGVIAVPEFARPFRYSVPFGLAAWNEPAGPDLTVMFTPDVAESGISFWILGPGWAASCSAPEDLAEPADWSPASIETYLRAIPELSVGDASSTTVGGRSATVLDVTTAAGATGCDGDEYVRMFRESGNESGLSVGHSARLILIDADGATFVIELWGADPDTWWPVAQQVVDTVSFDVGGAPDSGSPVATSAADETSAPAG